MAQITISRLELAYFLNCDTISRQEPPAYFLNERQSPVRVCVLPHFLARSTISTLDLTYLWTISRQKPAYFPNEVQYPVRVSILPHFVALSTISRLELAYILNPGSISRQKPAYTSKWSTISSNTSSFCGTKYYLEVRASLLPQSRLNLHVYFSKQGPGKLQNK